MMKPNASAQSAKSSARGNAPMKFDVTGVELTMLDYLPGFPANVFRERRHSLAACRIELLRESQ